MTPVWDKPAPKKAAPVENLKPRRGMLVLLNGDNSPGVWQILDPAPADKERGIPAGSWWLSPWNDEARHAPRDKVLGSFRRARYDGMKPASTAGVRNG